MSSSEGRLTQESDLELLQLTSIGDKVAFEIFVERHQAAVFRHGLLLTGKREDAEDLLQETFLSALKAAAQFRGEASGRTWLFHITRNAALRQLERTRVVSESDLDLETLAQQAGWGSASPESLAMLAEDTKRLASALEKLPVLERETLLLREWEGFSGEKIAELLGISVAAVKSRLHRARLHLAAVLRCEDVRNNCLEGGMWCSQVLAGLSEFLDGELAPEVVAQVREHLEHCVNCSRFGIDVADMLRHLAQSKRDMPTGAKTRLRQTLERCPLTK